MTDDARSTTYWLGELRRGNPEARDQLLAIMNTRLRAITSRMLRRFPSVSRYDETDDVWQEAAMKLCRALGALQSDRRPDSTERFVGLACLQVRRTLIDLARKHAGPHADANHFDSAVVDTDGNHQTPDRAETTLNPERLARWSEFHERVDDLPDYLLQVFNLVYYAGLNHTEAAEVLNSSRQTVARRYRQALEHLARFLPVDD